MRSFESRTIWKEDDMSVEMKQPLKDLFLKLDQLKGYL